METTEIKRIYHPYYMWEENKYNMYGNIDIKTKKNQISKVVRFFQNYSIMSKYMEDVLEAFPNSCEHNLSNMSLNRIAFIGQCSVALYDKIPRDITMIAWNFLTPEIQNKANKCAQKQIDKWEKQQLIKQRGTKNA